MKGRQTVDPIIIREVQRLQAMAEGLPPRAERRIKGLVFKILLLDFLVRNARLGPDWGLWARCYHGITDALAEAYDEAMKWAH